MYGSVTHFISTILKLVNKYLNQNNTKNLLFKASQRSGFESPSGLNFEGLSLATASIA